MDNGAMAQIQMTCHWTSDLSDCHSGLRLPDHRSNTMWRMWSRSRENMALQLNLHSRSTIHPIAFATVLLCVSIASMNDVIAWHLVGRNANNPVFQTVEIPVKAIADIPYPRRRESLSLPSRRSFIHHQGMSWLKISPFLLIASSLTQFPTQASAKADCFADCLKNCKAIVPKDLAYCNEECTEYCSQPDRQDGLSGSVSSDKGEVGILGGTFGTGTVVTGEDKPPSIRIPGLDFSSTEGRKLIGL